MRSRSRVGAVAALVAVAAAVVPALATPAAADIGDGTGGNNHGGSYSAWAYYVSAGGRDNVSTPEPCILEDPETAHLPAFIEYEVIEWNPGEFTVYRECVAVMFHDRQYNQINGFQDWQLVDADPGRLIIPAPIDDLVARAIASLDPDGLPIATDLGPGVDGLVNMPVHFSVVMPPNSVVGTAAEDPPIRVELSAWPDPTVPVAWDPGDTRQPVCDPAGYSECTHEYGRSSHGERHDGLAVNEYRVTAEVTYTGRYDVYGPDGWLAGAAIGNVTRTSVLGLAVGEAQSLNTRD